MEQKINLDKDGNFIVQESAMLNYLTAAICLAILFGVLIIRNFERDYPISSFYLIYALLLVPAAASLIKLKRSRSIIIVNGEGIYYRGNFITNWINFDNAYIAEETPAVSDDSDGLSDKFNIMIIYFEPAKGENYIYKMKMSGTQNKSEEQIISAIQYFSGKALPYDVFTI